MNSLIIDFHAHIFPEKIAYKAVHSIGAFYDAPMTHSGSSEGLRESGKRIGVSRYVVHSTATRADQVASINDFISAECAKHPEFIGFGTLHKDLPDVAAEIERMQALGLKGIKLHPDFQRFTVDDPGLDTLYTLARERNLPVLVHAGDARYDFSGPRRIANALDKFPGLIMIAAHFGGYTEWGDAMEYLAGRDVYFDTSSTLWKLPVPDANKMIRKHGVEKMLFGTDYPMWDHADEFTRFSQLDLNPEERELVLHKNAEALLKRIGA
jgi:predicted TIM-barrel fold metal-dependent hydrolase